jgi:MFS-type transporter involved in bile tolerance (Atg22 family)
MMMMIKSFQKIQSLSALETSARYVPMIVVGAATNIVTGFLVDKVQVRTLVVTSAVLTAISPLCMAMTGKPGTGYWRGPFEAMFFMPLHADGRFS